MNNPNEPSPIAIDLACQQALAAHPGARIIRVRAPRALLTALRALFDLPVRMPRGSAFPPSRGYPIVRCDDRIEHIEVDLELTYRVVAPE